MAGVRIKRTSSRHHIKMKFEKLKKISEGAFGFIEKITDDNGNFFARKVLHEQRHRDNVYRLVKKRFYDEVAYMENHHHTNLTEIIEADLDVERPWYIMPMAQASVRDDLKELKENSDLTAIALYDILSGLEFVHKSGYYHRDVCCANALRFQTDKGPRYKLSDFGVVTKIDAKGPFHKIDSGHARYAPPEITRRPMIGSEKSDIYGFGAILHEIYGKEDRSNRKTIVNETGPFATIMQKCTQITPDDRYNNIQELFGDLAKVITPPHH